MLKDGSYMNSGKYTIPGDGAVIIGGTDWSGSSTRAGPRSLTGGAGWNHTPILEGA